MRFLLRRAVLSELGSKKTRFSVFWAIFFTLLEMAECTEFC